MRRSIPLVLLAAASALLLTACAGGGSTKAKSTPKPTSTAVTATDLGCSMKPGEVSNGVKVSGTQGSTPTVDVTKGAAATTEQRTVVTEGTGAKPGAGTKIVIGFAAYDATSGKTISDPFGWGDQQGTLTLRLGDGGTIPGLSRTFGCEPVGSRVVYASTASTAFGGASNVKNAFSDGSVKATDTVVFVGDVLGILADKADGAAQAPQPGLPTVKLATNGAPTISYDKSATPPSSTEVEVLKKGTGATVASGDMVSVQYQGTEWKSGKVFDQTWGSSHGCTFPSTPSSFTSDGVVKGFSEALVGQTVGSQVEVVMTPADGYGATPPTGQKTITSTSTLIFVVDILNVDMPAAEVQAESAQGTTCD